MYTIPSGSGSTEVQAIYDALPDNGGTLFFPYGRYKFDTAITGTKSNVRFLGEGVAGYGIGTPPYGSSEIYTDGTNRLFDLGEEPYINHKGPVFETLAFADDGGVAAGAVRIKKMSHARFINCAVADFITGCGLSFEETVDAIIHGFVARNTLKGIQADVETGTVNVYGGDFLGIGLAGGIGIDAAGQKMQVWGTHFDAWETGIRTSGLYTKVIGANFEHGIANSKHVHITGGNRCKVIANTFGSGVDGLVIDDYPAVHSHTIGPNSYFSLTGSELIDNTNYGSYANLIYEPELGAGNYAIRAWTPGHIDYLLANSRYASGSGSRWIAGANGEAIRAVIGAEVADGPFFGTLTDHDMSFMKNGNCVAKICSGNSSPEGAVTAPVGSIYFRTDGAAGSSFYVKELGTGKNGWVGK